MDDEMTELYDAEIPRVDLVDKAANGTRFLIAKNAGGLVDADTVRELIGKARKDVPPAPAPDQITMTGSPAAIMHMIHGAAVAKAERSTKSTNDLPDSAFAYIEPGGHKDDEGKTVPRSLRHFPIDDEAHVRNALSRAPQSPFGDKAMPAIRRAAKKFGIDISKESAAMADTDLTSEPLLADGDGGPGSETQPGSPAWEMIDAATACKWTAILARAKAAVELLADRETLEATAGDDPDDMDNAFCLQDACCAIDYAISVLAPFAVAEQSEAEVDAEDMGLIGKALTGYDTAGLDTIEALGHVRKAGKVLSARNEQAIRDAVESLQKVLASLPAPPEETMIKEEGDVPEQTETVTKTEDTDETPAGTTAEDPVVKTEDDQAPTDDNGTDVTKADGEGKTPQVAVYDAKGNLVGIVDPADVTPISGADKADDGDEVVPDDAGDATPDGAQTADLMPAPAAEVGTAADDVAKNAEETTDDSKTPAEDVLKSLAEDVVKAALDARSAAQEEVIAKQAADLAQANDVIKALGDRVKALEEQPAVPGVFTNGAVPPAHLMRGQDGGIPPIDVAKARQRKADMYAATDARDQDAIAKSMQEDAIAALENIHRRG